MKNPFPRRRITLPLSSGWTLRALYRMLSIGFSYRKLCKNIKPKIIM